MSITGISERRASAALAIAAPSATSTASALALPPACVITAAAAPHESADFETQMTVTPLAGQGFCDRLADSAARARDQGRAVLECEHG
jgi:hypothetical protein